MCPGLEFLTIFHSGVQVDHPIPTASNFSSHFHHISLKFRTRKDFPVNLVMKDTS